MTVDDGQRPMLSDVQLSRINAWWRAALPEHLKPLLLGHRGTTRGLNFSYAHLNRAIMERDLNTLYATRPGHGGPGPVVAGWLEGTSSETYPDVSQSLAEPAPAAREPG